MKREENTLGNVFFIICVCSYVTAIVTFQEDEKESVVPTTNETILEKLGEDGSFKDNLTYDKLEESSENVDFNTNQKIDVEIGEQPIYADFTSQNSGILNDLTTTGTPLSVTLHEDISSELKAKVEELSASVAASQLERHINQTDDFPQPIGDPETQNPESNTLEELKNETDVTQNATGDAQEDIPSFSEWAQKRIEEDEKNGEIQNDSAHHQAASNGKSGSGVKLGWKNYAAPDCGAKVVAANPEAISPKSVISPSREEYKLNVCTNRIWFIVELCEAIQAKKIDIANFELFSSTPKDFVISIGDRFPSREWSTVGQFTTQDVRDIQSFDLSPHLFGRYIKVEVKSHHGSQHYCPISLFRVYGTSELEVLQKEELAQAGEEDDEDDNETLDAFAEDKPKNMLNSATNAVFSIFKKAAEVLVTKSNDTAEKSDDEIKKPEYTPLINTCSTPSHRIVCANCSDVLFGQIYELISCKSVQLHNLIGVPFIRRSLIHSNICYGFGLSFNQHDHHSTFNRSSRSVESFFSNKILGAMCNVLSVAEKKGVLNISLEYSNKTDDLEENVDDLPNIETSNLNLKVEHSIDHPVSESDDEIRPTEELNFVMTNHVNIPKSSCSTDVAYSSQIKPTKTVTLDVLVDSSNVPVDSETEELPVEGSKTDLPVGDSEIENERVDQIETKINETQQSAEINATAEISTESSENMDQMENFMVDMNGENGASTVPSVSASSSNERQKESVFLRLSNRIKVLERNVSLSSQYLEELSRRYKKQVEEMQKLLDKTLQSMTEERKRMDERNQQLEERLEQLMTMIGKWPSILFWFVFTVAASCGMLWLCRSDGTTKKVISSENIERRNSVDIIRTGAKKTKIRRPSDQALKIVRSSLLHEERKLSKEKRKRKKSNKGMKRSNSVTGLESDGSKAQTIEKKRLSPSKELSPRSTPGRVQSSLTGDQLCSLNNSDWVEENQRLLEVTLLDESEHSSLEPISTLMDHCVPQYTKTATDIRAHRMSSQYNKPNVNGDSAFRQDVPRKTVSLDESYSSNQDIHRRSSLNSKSEGAARKKGKKSFRSVLKNVFT